MARLEQEKERERLEEEERLKKLEQEIAAQQKERPDSAVDEANQRVEAFDATLKDFKPSDSAI